MSGKPASFTASNVILTDNVIGKLLMLKSTFFLDPNEPNYVQHSYWVVTWLPSRPSQTLKYRIKNAENFAYAYRVYSELPE